MCTLEHCILSIVARDQARCSVTTNCARTECVLFRYAQSERSLSAPLAQPVCRCGSGHPCRHGDRFDIKDLSTWRPPDEALEFEDQYYGGYTWNAGMARTTARQPTRSITLCTPACIKNARNRLTFLAGAGGHPAWHRCHSTHHLECLCAALAG